MITSQQMKLGVLPGYYYKKHTSLITIVSILYTLNKYTMFDTQLIKLPKNS